MNAVRGRVRGGHVEIDTALPEGAEVVVLTQDRAEPFDLPEGDVTELESRIASAGHGELVPAAVVLEKLRRAR